MSHCLPAAWLIRGVPGERQLVLLNFIGRPLPFLLINRSGKMDESLT